ncbi:hypothetical protein M8818_002820 [Zalaria obscura]|uniref:Uncharacterized protein n=1 Tax=Zalaria obscura TaxID=2024903 RepID=A0ACC3SH08_9PEZI
MASLLLRHKGHLPATTSHCNHGTRVPGHLHRVSVSSLAEDRSRKFPSDSTTVFHASGQWRKDDNARGTEFRHCSSIVSSTDIACTDTSMNNPSLQVSTLLNPDDSHPRNSIPSTPTSARLPQSNNTLPSINQGFDAANHHRGSVDYLQESRRSSVDSRMYSGFSNLNIVNNPTSPYESQNTSQVSLAASLRRPNGAPPMSPLSGRNSLRAHHPAPRVAPPISGRLPNAPDPMAAKPTQGFPWAFPDQAIPEEQPRRASSSDSSVSHSISRQNSFAASSIRSSIFSVDSQLPHGQRRFDDEPGTTHHHSMQHRAVSSLQNESTPQPGGGNYSRTPELRISHKLAERKRRSEMKDLFEELNRAVPTNGGAKASKWEILSKGMICQFSVHVPATD